MEKPYDYKTLLVLPQGRVREVLLDKICYKYSNGVALVSYPDYYIFGELDTSVKFEGFSIYILKRVSPRCGFLGEGNLYNLTEVFRHANRTMLLEYIVKKRKEEENELV